MNKKLNNLLALVKKDLGIYLSITFGIFVFLLFFQPFPIERFDPNNNLLFVSGIASIVFVFMTILRAVVPWLFRYNALPDQEPGVGSYFRSFLLMVLSSVAIAFYLRYVGWVSISFYIMFRVVLVCMAPPIILRLYDSYRFLQFENEKLALEHKEFQLKLERCEGDGLMKSISFISEYGGESLKLILNDVVFLRSADNYVEIVFLEGGQVKKKLIRNTLKNLEKQLTPYRAFIRCHRSYIVNTNHIEKLHKRFNNHSLFIRKYEDSVPVSRQYLLRIKEVL